VLEIALTRRQLLLQQVEAALPKVDLTEVLE
jgi:hypothetical protein